MRRTVTGSVLFVLLTAGLATGCSEARQATDKTADCAALVRDAAGVRVNAPSLAELEQQIRRLDERIKTLDNAEVRAAAQRVRDAANKLTTAVRSGNRATIDSATQELRAAARNAAATCNIPLDRLPS